MKIIEAFVHFVFIISGHLSDETEMNAQCLYSDESRVASISVSTF